MSEPQTKPKSIIRADHHLSNSNQKVVIGPQTGSEVRPQLKIHKRPDGAIQQIEVTCKCGETILLDCQYDSQEMK